MNNIQANNFYFNAINFHFKVKRIHLQKECDFLEEYINSVQDQAEKILRHMKSTFNDFKKTHGYVNRDYANISNMSEDAIKFLLSDKSKNPGYITVTSLGTSLGLDLNELAGYTPPQKAEISVVTTANESYVAEIISLCDKRVEDVKAMCEQRIADNNAMWEARLADKDAMYERIIKELKEK